MGTLQACANQDMLQNEIRLKFSSGELVVTVGIGDRTISSFVRHFAEGFTPVLVPVASVHIDYRSMQMRIATAT
jgi:hypothetical protein